MNLLLLLLACGSPAPLEKPNPPPEWPMTNGEGVDGSRATAEKAAKAKADAKTHADEEAHAAEGTSDGAPADAPVPNTSPDGVAPPGADPNLSEPAPTEAEPPAGD